MCVFVCVYPYLVVPHLQPLSECVWYCVTPCNGDTSCLLLQFRLSAGSRALSDPEKIFTRQDKIGKGNFGEVYKGLAT